MILFFIIHDYYFRCSSHRHWYYFLFVALHVPIDAVMTKIEMVTRSDRGKNAVLLALVIFFLLSRNLYSVSDRNLWGFILSQNEDYEMHAGEEVIRDFGKDGIESISPTDPIPEYSVANRSHFRGKDEFNKEMPSFRILCTSHRTMMKWGSFKIRCREFKTIAEQCSSVKVSIHSHKQIIFGANMSIPQEVKSSALKDFNATISMKRPLMPIARFGRIFVDVVDDYKMNTSDLEPGNEVIVQSMYHGLDRFTDRKYHVVEHWYNSFPQDMLFGSETPQFTIPKIEAVSTLKVATVWNNKGNPCPRMSSNLSDIVYFCVDKPYGIKTWYKEFFEASNDTELGRLDSLSRDPKQGSGRIYFELFWRFHALVVPAKTSRPEKLRYGNVQRAISQMRSGIPVLLEINGEVFQDFLINFNYTCVFVTNNSNIPPTMARPIWSLDGALQAMKSAAVRQKCQDEGFEIAKYYSPSTIVRKELRLLGYQGEFDCNR